MMKALMRAGLLVVGLTALIHQPALAQPKEEGQDIFQEKCASCHTIGGGRLVGPDLQGVTARRDRDWLTRMISAPDKMLAAGDPIAIQLLREHNNTPMPNLGLKEHQVKSVIAYLSAPGGGPSVSLAVVAATIPGDAARGKNLFTGLLRFQNGGSPCMACHSIAGIGALGGGALGPDLTPAFNKYGEVGLTNFLATMPLPTMSAVWATQPLIPEEQAHVRAFLQHASVSGRPIEALGTLALLAAGGAVVLLVALHLLWRRRLTAVRAPMIARRPSRAS